MHAGAYNYVAKVVAEQGPFARVLEIGSRNINGGVRPLFPGSDYTGLDVTDGAGVDVVADAVTWKAPKRFDAVVCCEVLEHTPDAEQIVVAAGRATKRGGVVVITAAAPEREPHSAVDGGPIRKGEHYANIDPDDLGKWLAAIGKHEVTVDRVAGDVYGWARKK